MVSYFVTLPIAAILLALAGTASRTIFVDDANAVILFMICAVPMLKMYFTLVERTGTEVVVRELTMPYLRETYDDLAAACVGADVLV